MESLKSFLEKPVNYNHHYGDGYGNGDGNGHGYGNGYGYGYSRGYSRGSGNGSGNGRGNSRGSGNGDGYGYGHDNGHGYGKDIKSFNKQNVYLIDDLQTIITSIKNNVAKGYILKGDLTLEKCFIVKNEHCFAHGETLKEALQSLEEKTNNILPVEERITNFKETFKDYNKKVKASLLYDWHFKLTGSCKMGRDVFVSEKGIDLSKDKLTIHQFIDLTINAYGGDIIKMLV